MKKTISLSIKIIITATFFFRCTPQQPDISKQAAEQITNADKAMSAMATHEGFYKALLFYADDSVIKPNDGEFPVIGKQALTKYWKGNPGPTAISWEPFKAEASKSGDMGYTLGNWKFVTNNTILYGNYYTFWKKQNNGTWKFVVDGGNNTPPRK